MASAALEILQHKNRPDRAEFTSFRQDIEILKSSFYFIRGKIEHCQENFPLAFE
jgi:hypothetical protein